VNASPVPAYRAADVETFALGADAVLVYCRDTATAQVVPGHLADLLARCAAFASLDQHARDRGREFGLDADGAREVHADLADLVARRLLIPVPPRTGAAAGAVPPPIAAIGIVTRNRSEALARALEGYADNLQRHGRPAALVVMDDSDTPGEQAATRAVLQTLGARRGVEARYAGLGDKRAFAAALAGTAGVDPALVEFAFLGVPECTRTYGGNRNALLLATAGDMILAADDDTICRVAPAPGAAPGLEVSSEVNPTEFAFFADEAAALRAVAPGDHDVLGLHERFLGRQAADVLAAAGDPLGLDAAGPGLLRRLGAGGSRILTTMNGFVGPTGIGTPLPLLFLAGASRRSLVAVEAVYRAALAGGPVVRAVRRATVTPVRCPSSMFLGLDNRELLPPFFPVTRGEDITFGQTLTRIFPDACSGWLPWVLRHAPLDARHYPPGAAVADARRISMTRVVMACLGTAGPGPFATPADALRAAGRHLGRLAALAPADFDEQLAVAVWRHASERIAYLEGLLAAEGPAPDWWAGDVKRVAAALQEALQDPRYVVPRDPGFPDDPAAARQLARRLVGLFGRLLEAWPDIVTAARRLRGEGRGLAQADERRNQPRRGAPDPGGGAAGVGG
jgi:hypothetical protein